MNASGSDSIYLQQIRPSAASGGVGAGRRKRTMAPTRSPNARRRESPPVRSSEARLRPCSKTPDEAALALTARLWLDAE